MHFKYPEILFFLFLLIIPILIHLFQLQRFKKEAFTNVKLLKEIELETRKSSKLKKLLILLSRLMLLSFLIIAFSQPYFSRNETEGKYRNVIYLDNSMSMQARDKNGGDLLQVNKNLLYEKFSENELEYTLITNDKTLENLDYNLFRKALLDVDFYPVKKDINQVLLQIDKLKKNSSNALFNIILISDFQIINNTISKEHLNENDRYNFVQPALAQVENISIDTAWISEEKEETLKISSVVSSYKMDASELSVSLFVEDKLYGKTRLNLEAGAEKEIEFSVPYTSEFQGKISLTDHRLNFDNDLFFSINEKTRTKVLVIGNENKFLKRIYQPADFELQFSPLSELEQGILRDQNLIILNELEKIPNALLQLMKNFVQDHGNLVIIPSPEADIFTYNNFFSALNIGSISGASSEQKRVTSIHYEHPFFNGVFEKKIMNFQYPVLEGTFDAQLNNSSPLLSFENRQGFVFEIPYSRNKLYWIASPLSDEGNSFISSPLIVPLFYNFSKQHKSTEAIYRLIGEENQIEVAQTLESETPLTISNDQSEFIPLQSKRNNKVLLTTRDFPKASGVYEIKNGGIQLGKLAYNYNRKESELVYNKLDALENMPENIHSYNSVEDVIKELNDRQNNQNLWHLFIILALVFLILEILLQKFLKN